MIHLEQVMFKIFMLGDDSFSHLTMCMIVLDSWWSSGGKMSSQTIINYHVLFDRELI